MTAIIFKGELVHGFDRNSVKEKFAQMEGLIPELAEEVFSGKTIVLKDELSDTDITDYFPSIVRLGMVVSLEESIPRNALYLDGIRQSYHNKVTGKKEQQNNVSYAPTPRFFSLKAKGRYGRLNFINASLNILVLNLIAIIIGGLLMEKSDTLGLIIYFCLLLPIFLLSLRVVVLRLQDINLPRVLVVIFFLSIGILGFILMVIPGTKGSNNYGCPSKRGNAIGLILMILFFLLIIFSS